MSVGNYVESKFKDLQIRAEKATKDELNKIGKEIVNQIKFYTVRDWYNTYEPKDYVRTGQFLDTVKYRIMTAQNRVAVFYDFRLLKHEAVKNNWGIHQGFNGHVFTDGLVRFIETGQGGGLSPRSGNGGSQAILKTEKDLQKYIDKEVKRRLEYTIGAKLK